MDVFGFSKTETNGFLVLILLVFVVAIVPRVYFYFYEPDFDSDESLALWAREMEQSLKVEEERRTKSKYVPERRRVFVDPNSASAEKLVEAGFPEKMANRIVNYRSKGGQFRKSEDLKKIYGFSDELYDRIRSSVAIPRQRETEDVMEDYALPDFEEEFSFDLNTATSQEMKKVKGIGQVLSKRIVKYRELLGGYQDITQLNEVFGLKPEVILEISKHCSIVTPHLQISLNQTDSIKVLAGHPYIDYSLARMILNYREVHGDFKDISELKNIKVLDDSLYHKIAPYLSL